jgi:head-tail adaptor
MVTPTHLLTDSCSIQRSTTSLGTSGNPQLAWANHLSGVKCRVQVSSGDESPRYGRLSSRYHYRVYVAGGQDITEHDRVIWGSRTLDILDADDFDGLGVLVRLGCEETREV